MLRRGFFLDKTYVFVYNVGGNILSRSEYVYTEGELGTPVATYNYAYGNAWKDQLTSYNGSTIVYDASGNPTIYLGATLTWNRGRFLASYLKGSKTVIMQYDANGFRRAKTRRISSTTLNSSYVYSDDGKLIYEQSGTFERYYFYSADGIVGYEENGEMFWYKKNFFGDITAVYRGTQKVAEYVYDAWGNCTVKTDTNGYGSRNPFRYRGYYFDNDLGMYYLITRYYDPKVGRFISADSIEYLEPGTINGLNLYAYCGNNPVMYADPMGTYISEVCFDGEYDLDDDMYSYGGGGSMQSISYHYGVSNSSFVFDSYLLSLGTLGPIAAELWLLLVKTIFIQPTTNRIKLIIQFFTWFAELIYKGLQPLKDELTEDALDKISQGIADDSLHSSRAENAYTMFGRDMKYAMYEEFGIDYDFDD